MHISLVTYTKTDRKKWTPDLTGKIFGKITVIGFLGRSIRGNVWDCICICGNKITTTTGYLNSGITWSCGCDYINPATSHKMVHSRVYRIWSAMKSRCNNSKTIYYNNYGGRGIKVCERWNNSFEFFLHDMGQPPSLKHSIERIDNNIGYNIDNCKWATGIEQARNRRNNNWYELNGESKLLMDWATDLKINYTSINHRLREGYSFKQIYNHYKLNPKGSRIKKSLCK